MNRKYALLLILLIMPVQSISASNYSTTVVLTSNTTEKRIYLFGHSDSLIAHTLIGESYNVSIHNSKDSKYSANTSYQMSDEYDYTILNKSRDFGVVNPGNSTFFEFKTLCQSDTPSEISLSFQLLNTTNIDNNTGETRLYVNVTTFESQITNCPDPGFSIIQGIAGLTVAVAIIKIKKDTS